MVDNTNTPNATQFGNYVMIRHTRRVYDTASNTVGYAYSIYAHLKELSVIPSVGTSVVAGTEIAASNNTGNSNGAHLHYQVVYHSLDSKTNPEEWTWSEFQARNPELWIPPYGSAGSSTTGTIAGRLSDASGNAVDAKTIVPDNPIKNNANTNGVFGWMTTYNYTWTNPDEIFGENFGTTDVSPGTHCFSAKNANNSTYRNMGCTTVVAGQTSYLGLYPIGFPDANGSSSGTISTISLLNISTDRAAKGLTSYIQSNGTPAGGRQSSSLATRGSANFNATSALNGGAIAVVTEETAGIIQNSRNTSTKSKGAYSGKTQAEAATYWYVPLVMYNRYTVNGTGNSIIHVMNMDNRTINITIHLIGDTNAGYANVNYTSNFGLGPYESVAFNASYTNNPEWLGSATVNGNGAKIVVSSEFRQASDTVQSFNALAQSTPEWVIPLFMSNLQSNNLNTPVAIQNVGSTINSGRLELKCKAGSGSPNTTDFTVTNTSSIPGNSAYYFNPITDDTNGNVIEDDWFGTCRVKALDGQNIVVFVQMRVPSAVSGSGWTTSMAAAYEAMPANGGKTRLTFPYIQKVSYTGTTINGGASTGVTIHNLSTSTTANLVLNYYNPNGTLQVSKSCSVPADKQLIHNHRLIDEGDCEPALLSGWVGSLVVTSNTSIDGFNQITDRSNPSGDHFMAHNATR